MSKTGLLAAFGLFFLLAVNVQAANICDDVDEQLPGYPSVNGSMLLVISESEVDSKLSSVTEPMKILWQPVDFDTYSYFGFGGSMRRFNDCWVCELTGKDASFVGACGPSPFTKAGVFRIDFRAMDFTHVVEFNRTIVIHSKRMSTGINIESDGTVHITADTPTNTKEAWITLYDAEDGDMIPTHDKASMNKTEYPGRYLTKIDSLSGGTYYASFGFRTTTGETGGDFIRFSIGDQEVELTAETDKDEYFIGETAVISGRTKYSSVSASIRTPGGTAESLGSVDAEDGRYSYDFHITGDEEGDYELTVKAGGKSVKETISVTQLMSVYPLSYKFDVKDLYTELETNISIQNLGNDTLTLSASSEGISDYVTTEFGNTSLAGSWFTKLKITVDPSALSASRAGRVLITAGDVTIPVDITLNLETDVTVTVAGTSLKISPSAWREDDCMVGKPVRDIFTVDSLEGEITDFECEETGLTLSDYELPDSVDEGTYGSLELEITPGSTSTSGSVEIKSSGGSAVIYVDLDCVDDSLADDISVLVNDVEDLKLRFSDVGFDETAIGSIFYMTTAELDGASSSLDSESYSSASESYMSAQASYEALESVVVELEINSINPEEESPLMTWVVIIVVVAIVAVLGFMLYNKFGSKLLKKSEAKEEEAEDEELY